MRTILVSYDLIKDKNYEPLFAKLKALGAIKVLYSEWILRTGSTCSEIYDALSPFIDGDDMLLVVALTGEATWNKVMISNDSLKKIIAA